MRENIYITLQRQRTSDHGTEGILHISHLNVSFFTLELPWRENRGNISCIPTGTYEVCMRKSPRFGLCYWVQNVENRSFILIHAGNFAGDTSKGLKSNVHGCILLGKKRGILAGQRAVITSKSAVDELSIILENESFNLIIKGV